MSNPPTGEIRALTVASLPGVALDVSLFKEFSSPFVGMILVADDRRTA
jgi:hypothetical protein